MEFVNLGYSGLQVSRIGLGTIPFGTVLDDAACERIVGAFGESGGNLIDTANQYGGGQKGTNEVMAGAAEEAVGRALRGRRERFVVATKGYWLMGDELLPNSVGLSRSYLQREIDASLRRLATDWIDLYQCHAFDFYTPVEETLRALDDAVAAGKIRYVGVSNWDSWHVVKGVMSAASQGLARPISNEVWYNLLDRSIEHSVVPACRDQGVGIIAWGVAANGMLSGRYGPTTKAKRPGRFATEKDGESSSWHRLANSRSWRIVDLVTRIAADLGWVPVNVATRWVLDSGVCDVALVGGSSVDQYQQQLSIADAALPNSVADELAEASSLPEPYPLNLLNLFGRREGEYYGGIR